MADNLDSTRLGHRNAILGKSASASERRRQALGAQAANALTIARFGLGGAWIALYIAAHGARMAFAAIAVAAATSDFLDGRVARRFGIGAGAGRWLDPAADVTFVLAALGCAAAAGAIPIYIPILIAVSFAQYAIDSRLLHRTGGPVRSRLGHYGGVVNYGLVLVLAFAPPGSIASRAIRESAPALAIFYIAAIAERALEYRPRA
ncbi:MAG TPA: CDP-alcohol phosphatidyltransferase family protein [Candidatus Binataceae bacterium]|nr:CDP-alcohol phosphatidyltransferase family protein [Candidatus Binataceae bacterium]